MTPFDHLKNLHTKKKNWDNFNDEEKYFSELEKLNFITVR